jgi:hypothetical protein
VIIEAIFAGFAVIISNVLAGLFQAVQLIPGGGSVAGGVILGYAWLDTFLPAAGIVAGLVFLLSLYSFFFSYRLVREAIGILPGMSS